MFSHIFPMAVPGVENCITSGGWHEEVMQTQYLDGAFIKTRRCIRCQLVSPINVDPRYIEWQWG